ncbi:MAG: hypothetical protein R2705_01555 [Ilumatobacteraceae bacterium]
MHNGVHERSCPCPILTDDDLAEIVRDGAMVPAMITLRTGVGCETCLPELTTRIRDVFRPAA